MTQFELINFMHCRLVGDVCMCTGFLSYAGPFNQEFRNRLLSNWEKGLAIREIPLTSQLNLADLLSDAPTVSTLL